MEYFDIVDENGIPTGRIVARKEAHEKGQPHRSAHVWITREKDGFYAVMLSNTSKGGPWDLSEEEGISEEKIPLTDGRLTVTVKCDFNTDTATCFIETSEGSRQIGTPHKLRFRLDHFTGCRFALSCFSTGKAGGTAVFTDFTVS